MTADRARQLGDVVRLRMEFRLAADALALSGRVRLSDGSYGWASEDEAREHEWNRRIEDVLSMLQHELERGRPRTNKAVGR